MKETYTGIFKGTEVTFNRVWSNHRFTDEECIKLCNGEEISIRYVTKDGRNAKISGQLALVEFKGKTFYGFKPDFTSIISETSTPNSWCSHIFTKEEKIELANGKSIHLTDCISRNGITFTCDITFDKNINKIVPNFNNNKQNSIISSEVGAGKSASSIFANIDQLNTDTTSTTVNFNELYYQPATLVATSDVSVSMIKEFIKEDPELVKIINQLICLNYDNGVVVIVYIEDYECNKETIMKATLESVIKDYAVWVSEINSN